MILQALVQHYKTLVAQGKIARPGWSDAKISFALCINVDGELEQVDLLKTEQVRGKKTVWAPQEMSLPVSRKKSSDITPDFLWDKSSYVLGIGKNPPRALECFQESKNFHHRLLDEVENPAARAVLAFFDRWDPSKAAEHPALQNDWKELASDVTLVFRYSGAFVHNDPLLQQIWQTFYDKSGESDTPQICLVTGEVAPIARIHPSILGAGGTNPKLVSFDKDSSAFCSYGRKQGANAPVSKYAAFAYTAALNYLIKNQSPAQKIGDTIVLFWAKSGQPAFQDFFFDFTFGGASFYDDGDLASTLEKLLKGDAVQYRETSLDPKMDFYILGISPNKGRVSVRFFLHNSFGGFLRNVQRHYDRLEIICRTKNKFETIPIWMLLDATTVKDKPPSPVMAGEVLRAVLTDTHYPASLLNSTILRARAEQRDKDHPNYSFKVTRERAAILKAYYLKKPHPAIQKEVLTVSLNPACNDPAYVLGRLFSVYEAIQSDANPGINATIKDKYFNSAAATPATIFPILGNLAQKHLKKLKGSNKGLCITYEKQIGKITSLLGPSFPARMSLPQQGAFQLGYYHQTQDRYQKKEEKQDV